MDVKHGDIIINIFTYFTLESLSDEFGKYSK